MIMESIGNGLVLRSQWFAYINQDGGQALMRAYVLRDEETMQPVQYGPEWAPMHRSTLPDRLNRTNAHNLYNDGDMVYMDLIMFNGARVSTVSDSMGFPLSYGPLRTIEDLLTAGIWSMEAIQECDGCMSGFHPDLINVSPVGTLLCNECMELEGY